ncbi:MAG: amino acid permease [Candidatus Aminicenantes bacterium]|jgi:APA family basic amino acid/polyamine antiporter|nr:amino acid permease [Candidatus Aminicenantes bacterium]MDH5383121.1 amino acid permease [Candidatus Aminicenantes bacterium]MDH5742196.1 amino acid permease [Candidatus Aminicenantes bacterium]
MDRNEVQFQDGNLERKLGAFSATAIVVANMIGTGIFTTSGLLAAQLPSPGWVLLCWIFGGMIAIAGALCYAELATRMPEAGGEYVYLKKLYHPALGFLAGWTSLIVGFSAPIAAAAMGFSEYIYAGLDSQLLHLNSTQLIFFNKGIAIAVILIFTSLHYLGLRLGSRVQNVLTILKILILVGLTSLGLIFGNGSGPKLSLKGVETSGVMAIGTAMMLVMFAYSGWNASAYIAGEIKRPKSTIPVSLIGGTSIVIVLYLAINLFIFRMVPYSDLKGVIPVVETASVQAFGEWMGKGVSLLVGVGLLSCLSAFIMIGPRVYYAMAKDRLFFPFAATVHARFRVPGQSILIQSAIAMLMVLIGSFEQLIIYIAFALNIFLWLAVVGVFLARKKKVGEESAVKVWGYPVVPVFFLLSSLVLMVFNSVNRPLESSAAVLTVLFGIPCYFLWVRSVGR